MRGYFQANSPFDTHSVVSASLLNFLCQVGFANGSPSGSLLVSRFRRLLCRNGYIQLRSRWAPKGQLDWWAWAYSVGVTPEVWSMGAHGGRLQMVRTSHFSRREVAGPVVN